MSMKDLVMMNALALMYGNNHFMPQGYVEQRNPNGVNAYEPQKLTGFTQIKGRRRLTKKQRKQLKSKKQ